MKKLFLVLICFFTLSVSMVFAQAYTANLGRFNLQLADNFEWGSGYNGYMEARNVLQGHQIRAGETWSLKVTFTVSRDLEEKLQVQFADRTEAAGWWRNLSENSETANSQLNTPIRAGQVYSHTFTLRTIADSTGGSGLANSLAFMTEGAGTAGRRGSGRAGPVTLNFTEFVLTRN